MKRVFFTLLLFCCLSQIRAQFTPGQFAPDFTLTDINGQDWRLYDYLAQGTPVIIDFTATWCAPCWTAHTSHVLEDIYEMYGPDGTGEVMVFFIESDPSTGLEQLYGQLGPSQGNWVEGTSYPIIDVPTFSIPDAFGVDAYPSIFLLSPDLTVSENLWNTDWSVANVYSHVQSVASATPPANDAAVHAYQDYNVTCDEASISVKLYNTGSTPLTEATIQLTLDGEEVATENWTGSLAFGESEEVSFGSISLPEAGLTTYEATLTTADAELDNNSTPIRWLKSPQATNQLVFYLESDENAEADSTQWYILDETNEVVLESGIIANNVSEEITMTIPDLGCYLFVFEDKGGDGLGEGYLIVSDSEGEIIFSSNAQDEFRNVLFNVSTVVGVPQEPKTIQEVTLFPNPVSDVATLQLELTETTTLQLDIRDLTGKQIRPQTTATFAAGAQSWTVPTADLPAGVYTISLRTDDGVKAIRLVKQNSQN